MNTETEQTLDTSETEAHSFSDLESLLRATPFEDAQKTVEPTQQLDDDLASQVESDAATETSETEQSADDDPQGMSVKDLAEKLGVEASDLYNGLRVDLGDGQSMSLSEMKHRAQDLARVDVLRQQSLDNQQSVENELLQKRQALQNHMQQMGYQPTEADQQAAAEQTKAYLDQQQRMALDAIPDWADKAARQLDEKAITALKTEYGFSAAEQPLIIDYRLVKLFRDHHKLRSEVRAVGTKKKPTKRNQAPGTHTQMGNKVTQIKSQISAGKVTADAAIDALGRELG